MDGKCGHVPSRPSPSRSHRQDTEAEGHAHVFTEMAEPGLRPRASVSQPKALSVVLYFRSQLEGISWGGRCPASPGRSGSTRL